MISTPDAHEIVEATVQRLFPAGSTLVESMEEVPAHRRYLILKGPDGPRWLVPWKSDHGASVLSLWKPYRLRSRLGWAGLRALDSLGLLPMLARHSDSFGVAGGNDWRHLGFSSDAPIPIVYVGTPSRLRKLVAFLTLPGSPEPQYVAKVPVGPGAAECILHEAEVLQRLNHMLPGVAPRLHYVDRQSARSVQTVIDGRPGGRRFQSRYLDLLCGLRVSGQWIRLATIVAYLAELAVIIDMRPEARTRILARLEKIGDGRSVPSVWIHGDFAPWNIRQRPGRRLLAVDWENAAFPGHPLCDLVHFHLMQDVVFGTDTLGGPVYRRAAREYMARLGIEESLHDVLVELTAIREWLHAARRGDSDFAEREFGVDRIMERIGRV